MQPTSKWKFYSCRMWVLLVIVINWLWHVCGSCGYETVMDDYWIPRLISQRTPTTKYHDMSAWVEASDAFYVATVISQITIFVEELLYYCASNNSEKEENNHRAKMKITFTLSLMVLITILHSVQGDQGQGGENVNPGFKRLVSVLLHFFFSAGSW